MRDQELNRERNTRIRRDFQKLKAEPVAVEYAGEKVFIQLQPQQIMQVLERRYFITARTIENVIYNQS
ncbi:hypothetical protein [Rufibacter quisquiliarum]|uniref:Uncharacterized protein n=1 Tax=Rufibacter quisquiliarum TaxID=1549639 RepID=A0A839GW43_9BACT|nr:hypothetical protein [Rufibacter quisquiliarum]MBA9078956.1 hypothetical protein [Rufibacter quisquiliarum]